MARSRPGSVAVRRAALYVAGVNAVNNDLLEVDDSTTFSTRCGRASCAGCRPRHAPSSAAAAPASGTSSGSTRTSRGRRAPLRCRAVLRSPAKLPPEVVWLRQSLGSISGVADGEADLVFGGEVIEHLWPDDIAGFLAESWRVLKPGGVLAIDSPNRIVCQAQRWTHPEHTLEFSVADIVRVLGVAGFEDVDVRGVWLCHDRDAHRLLSFSDLDGESLDRATRIGLAEDRPEDAFVWWAQAVRGKHPPALGRLNDELQALYSAYRPERLARMLPQATRGRWDPVLGKVVSADEGAGGVVFHGPYVPVAAGKWEACFRMARAGTEPPSSESVVAELDVAIGGEAVASRLVTAGDLPPDGSLVELCVPFDFARTTMGVEFRMMATGSTTLDAPLEVALRRREQTSQDRGAARDGLRLCRGRCGPRRRALAGAPRLTWPARRLLDPRMRLLHRNLERVEARLMARLDEIARTLR